MNIGASAEDYLEKILVLQKDGGAVRSVDIAAAMGFSKPSVSVAMKKLREDGLIVTNELGFITLTENGAAMAERVYERHLVITTLLAAIGVPLEAAAEDACRIEHIISQQTFDALKRVRDKMAGEGNGIY